MRGFPQDETVANMLNIDTENDNEIWEWQRKLCWGYKINCSQKSLKILPWVEALLKCFIAYPNHEKPLLWEGLFFQISNSVQSVNESTYDFVVKLMSQWGKVLILAKEEDCPCDEKLVQRRFLRAISAGIRNNNIHIWSVRKESFINLIMSFQLIFNQNYSAILLLYVASVYTHEY